MPKTISSSQLRSQIKRVLNEVEYGQSQYVIEKFGQPAAAIVSMADFYLLEKLRRQQPVTSLQQRIAGIRTRNRQLNLQELETLIQEAREEFYQLRSDNPDAD